MSLTQDERRVADMTADVVNAYWELPVEHPSDRGEFVAAIHRVQDLILARPGRRELNDIEKIFVANSLESSLTPGEDLRDNGPPPIRRGNRPREAPPIKRKCKVCKATLTRCGTTGALGCRNCGGTP